MLLHFRQMHHVGVFMIHVEEVDLMGQLCLIEGAFLDNVDVEAGRIAVHLSLRRLNSACA